MSPMIRFAGISFSWLLAIGTVIVGLLWFLRHARQHRSLEAIAKKYAGVVVSRPPFLFRRPKVIFPYRQGRVELVARTRLLRNGGRQTQITLGWPGLNTRYGLEIWNPATVYGQRKARRGPVQNLRTHPNRPLAMSTNDTAQTARILTPGIQWEIESIGRWSRNGFLLLRISRRRFTLSVGGHFLDGEQLHEVVLAALRIYDQMLLTQQSELRFVESKAVEILDNVNCPVCGCAIRGEIVICARCKTPHCAECWHYNGKCAIYACGEVQSIGRFG